MKPMIYFFCFIPLILCEFSLGINNQIFNYDETNLTRKNNETNFIKNAIKRHQKSF